MVRGYVDEKEVKRLSAYYEWEKGKGKKMPSMYSLKPF